MFYGVLNLSLVGYVVMTLVLTHITIVAVTVFLHRAQAHSSLKINPYLSHFFRFWLWLTTGMVTKAWVAIHRKHHARCETVDDPHSPQVLGISKVLWEGAELYRRESNNIETLERYGNGTPDDWLETHVYSSLARYGIFIMLGIDLFLMGIPGLAVWAIQMMWIPFFAAGVINGIGHYWGYRNFECLDAARNIVPWGILIGGEELHNNHHTYPTSAKLSVKWWEFDIGWLYIKLFSYLHLVEIKRIPPKVHLARNKVIVDTDTLKAVLANRFQILADYKNQVIIPVFREEKQKVKGYKRKLFEQLKFALIREESLVDMQSKQRLAGIFETSQTLGQVYQYRQKLQAIWGKTAATQRELVEALQEWCKQAESTGIIVLKRFACELKQYSV